ncbi:deoxyribonuclease V [Candidatus Hydrogenedentota bacterium]
MKVNRLHDWNISYKKAVVLQIQLRSRLILNRQLRDVRLVAGADVSCSRGDNRLYAGVVVLDAVDMSVVEEKTIVAETEFPYVPGFLSFREVPPLLKVFAELETTPDVVIFDGQGIAHPRRLGLASHAGLFLGIPTVGCAKSRLVGEYRNPGTEKGAWSSLEDKGEEIGRVLRTRGNVNPVFVSPGHLIDMESSLDLVLRMCPRYRISEPVRRAHELVNNLRRNDIGEGEN